LKNELTNEPKSISGYYFDYEKNRYFPIKNNHTQHYELHSNNMKNNINKSNLFIGKSIFNLLSLKNIKYITRILIL